MADGSPIECTEAELVQACGATAVATIDGQKSFMLRVGKKRARRLLDGKEHGSFPSAPTSDPHASRGGAECSAGAGGGEGR